MTDSICQRYIISHQDKRVMLHAQSMPNQCPGTDMTLLLLDGLTIDLSLVL